MKKKRARVALLAGFGLIVAGLGGGLAQAPTGFPEDEPLMLGQVSPGHWVEGNAGSFSGPDIGHPWHTIYSYRWQSGPASESGSFADIPGAAGRYYEVREEDVGSYLRFVATMVHEDDPSGPSVEAISRPEPVLAAGGPGAQIRTGAWGRVLPDIDEGRYDHSVVLPMPDGTIYIGGDFGSRSNGRTNRVWPNGLIRLEADGSMNDSFPLLYEFEGDDEEFPAPRILDMKRLPDGRIVIAGEFTRVNGRACKNIAVLNPDGTHDPGFICEGAIDREINHVFVETDGGFLVSGRFSGIDGISRPHFARLASDGTVDESFPPLFEFRPFGFAIVESVAYRSDGKRLVTGDFDLIGGVSRLSLALLNQDGTVDESFDPDPPEISAFDQVAVLPDDSFYAFSIYTKVGNVGPAGVFRYHADGTVDESFLPGNPVILAAEWPRLLDDGDLLVFTYDAAIGNRRPVRIAPDGSVRRWYEAVNFEEEQLQGVGVTGDGMVFAFLDGGAVGGDTFFNRLIRYNATDGQADRSFGVVPGTPGQVEALLVDAEGKILVGGAFPENTSDQYFGAGGRVATSIARLGSGGLADPSFQGPFFETVERFNQSAGKVTVLDLFPGGRILAGGDIIRMDGVPSPPLLVLLDDGSPDPGFTAQVTGIVTAATIQSDGKILVATKSRNHNNLNPRLHRLMPDGSPDAAFDPHADPAFPADTPFSKILVRPDGRILVTAGANAVMQILPNGAIDTGFLSAIPAEGGVASDMELCADGKLLALVRNEVYRLLPDGSFDPGFVPGPKVPGLAEGNAFKRVLRQESGKIVIACELPGVGSYPNSWPNRYFGMIRLQPDGSVDPSFQLRGFREKSLDSNGFSASETGIKALANAPGGNIYAGGYFREISGQGALSLALIDGGEFPAPQSLAGPALAGTFLPGFELSADQGIWDGGVLTFDYVWEIADDAMGANRVTIDAAEGNEMIAGDAAAGKYVRLVVRAGDGTLGPADLVFGESASAWVAIPEMTYERWRDYHFGPGSGSEEEENEDPDGDGKLNAMEYCYGTNPFVPNGELSEPVTVEDGGDSYPGIAFRSPVGATDVNHAVECSADVSIWESRDIVTGASLTVPVSETLHGDGTKTVIRRSAVSYEASHGGFMRVLAEEAGP